MAETELITSITGVAEEGFKSSSELYKIAAALYSAGSEVRRMAEQFESMSAVLTNLANFFKSSVNPNDIGLIIAEDLVKASRKKQDTGDKVIRQLKPLVYDADTGRRDTIETVRNLFKSPKSIICHSSTIFLQKALQLH